jgi:hypothetical protein
MKAETEQKLLHTSIAPTTMNHSMLGFVIAPNHDLLSCRPWRSAEKPGGDIEPYHIYFNNVPGKRVAQASESRTLPTLRTSMSVYLNNVII